MKEKENLKDVNFYLKQSYTRIIQKMDDGSGIYYYGRILELDGCQSTADTEEELYDNLNKVLKGYIEIKLEMGREIPLPIAT